MPDISQIPGYKEKVAFTGDYSTFQLDLHAEHRIAGFWLDETFIVSVADHEQAKKILHDCSERPEKIFRFLNPMFGQEYLDGEGNKSVRNENALPADAQKERNSFLRKQLTASWLKDFLPQAISYINVLQSKWEKAAHNAIPIILGDDLNQLALRIITYGIYRDRMDEQEREHFIKNFNVALTELLAVDTNNLSRKQKLDDALSVINQITDRLIEQESKQVDSTKSDLFSKIVQKQFDPDPVANKTIQRHQMHIIAMGGSHTIATSLKFILYFFAKYPPVLEEVQKEIKQSLADQVISNSFNSLRSLIYLESVIKETYRLFPAAYGARQIQNDYILDDYHFPAGTIFFIPYWALNKSKEYWGDTVDEFDPLRFKQQETRGKFLAVFGDGPISCPGQTYALALVKLMVVILARDLSFSFAGEFSSDKPLSVKSTFVLHPDPDLQLKVNISNSKIPYAEMPWYYKISLAMVVISFVLYVLFKNNAEAPEVSKPSLNSDLHL